MLTLCNLGKIHSFPNSSNFVVILVNSKNKKPKFLLWENSIYKNTLKNPFQLINVQLMKESLINSLVIKLLFKEFKDENSHFTI